MSRHARVPETSSPFQRREIVCGIDPAGALVRAAQEIMTERGVWSIAVYHDTGCPCTTSRQPMVSCTCEIVALEARRVR